MKNLTQKQSDILNSLKEEFIKLNSIEKPKGKLSFLLDEITLKQEDQEEKKEQMKIYEILKNENYNKFLNEAHEIVDELDKLGFSNFDKSRASGSAAARRRPKRAPTHAPPTMKTIAEVPIASGRCDNHAAGGKIFRARDRRGLSKLLGAVSVDAMTYHD